MESTGWGGFVSTRDYFRAKGRGGEHITHITPTTTFTVAGLSVLSQKLNQEIKLLQKTESQTERYRYIRKHRYSNTFKDRQAGRQRVCEGFRLNWLRAPVP